MNPFFSVITPTLQRDSLVATCESINSQSFSSWEHIIQLDQETVDESLFCKIDHPKRFVYQCDSPHRNGGNTCRSLALKHALGSWVLFCDDDNFYSDPDVFNDIAAVLPRDKQFAIFPIDRLGSRFYADPPRSCHTDTMNFVLRRDVAYWPDTDAYGTDGILVDDLMARGIPYAAFPNFRAIGVIPKISFCK